MVIPEKLYTDHSYFAIDPPNYNHVLQSQRMIGKYSLSKTLGKGSMGKVKLAINTETNEKMAVKIVPRKVVRNDLPNLSTSEAAVKRKKQTATELRREIRTIREASIMLLLDHPFIVRVEEMILVDDFYYIFMEYVDGGQLLDYIISHGKLKEKQARQFSRQIASALDYCHRNSIVHRDLKVENILIARTGNIKIIDFGLSNLFSPSSHLSTFCGSLYFAAPELLNGRVYTGPEVDVWSFGVVLYVLVCGQVPFDDPTVYGLHKKVKQGLVEYPSYLSSDIKDLIHRMLVTDAKKRASMSELIVHPWMTKGFDSPVENYLPKRKPLQLPIDLNVVHGMRGFEFGSEDSILEELEFLICNPEYQIAAKNVETLFIDPHDINSHNILKRTSFPCSVNDPLSLPAAYHPLISIYYLVKERMERNQLNSGSLSDQDSIEVTPNKNVQHGMLRDGIISDISPRLVPESGVCYGRNIYGVSSTALKQNVFRRMSRRLSGNHDEFTPVVLNNVPVKTSSPQNKFNISLGQKLNSLLKRGATITIKDLPSTQKNKQDHCQPKRNSVSCKARDDNKDSGLLLNGHADDMIRPVYLKGLFSVSTTSTKKASDIRCEIIYTLDKYRDIKYRETRDRFQCCMSIGTGQVVFNYSDDDDDIRRKPNPTSVQFDIYIVKIPWLLGMRGVQFRRICGDPWVYKNACSRILCDLRL